MVGCVIIFSSPLKNDDVIHGWPSKQKPPPPPTLVAPAHSEQFDEIFNSSPSLPASQPPSVPPPPAPPTSIVAPPAHSMRFDEIF